MSQNVWGEIIPSSTSGNQLASLLNGFKDAVMSGLKGPTRPTQTTPGGMWIDDSDEGNNIWKLRVFSGTQDIELMSINTSTGIGSISTASGIFNIVQISGDTISGVLNFIKERTTGGGQVLDQDEVGNIDFRAKDNSGNVQDIGGMVVRANDNITSSAQGSYIAWEFTYKGDTGRVEQMRLIDGKLGIGVINPEETIHAVGNIRAGNRSDTADSAEVILGKRRIAGTGAVQSGDKLGRVVFKGRDSEEDDYSGAYIETTAEENATDTDRGTKLEVYTTDIGEDIPSLKLKIDSEEIQTPKPIVTDDAYYIGDRNTDGSWRFIVDSGALNIEVRVAGVWVVKDTVNP